METREVTSSYTVTPTDLQVVNHGVAQQAAAEQIAGLLKPSSRAVPTASLPQTPANGPQKGGEADVHP